MEENKNTTEQNKGHTAPDSEALMESNVNETENLSKAQKRKLRRQKLIHMVRDRQLQRTHPQQHTQTQIHIQMCISNHKTSHKVRKDPR